MCSTAKWGYMALLMRSWESEECSLPNQEKSLQENSGMTVEEWSKYGAQILENFIVIENKQIRNQVCYDHWLKCGTAYEARRIAAEQTNAKRWGGRVVTDTVTDTVTENNLDNHNSAKNVNFAVVDAKTTAIRLMKLLGLAVGKYDIDIISQVITLEAEAAHTDLEEVGKFLFQAGQGAIARGEVVNAFWFKDRKFAQENLNGSRKSKPGVTKQRLNATLVALGEALAKRGVDGPWNHFSVDGETLAEPRE